MKKIEQKKIVSLNEFAEHCNLYNIVPSGKGLAIELLRKIADEVHHDNYYAPGTKRPSILLVGKEGKSLLAKAFLNSLAIEDVRECDAKHYNNGFSSKEFFEDSLFDSAHIIMNIEEMRPGSEAAIWQYLRFGRCSYTNWQTKSRKYIHLNGILILTVSTLDKVSKPIQKAVKYIVNIEPYNQEQLFVICHQYLKVFCGIEYQSEAVLQSIVERSNGELERIIELLRLTLLLVKAEQKETITEKVVERASRLMG